ncbi:MAG TPA: YafY family protein [Candidatus Sulfotelmatobacter sp.]|jgi:predicted DNA-binding transcriptional regulator YafY|nr:YafY family protein [Candidatus Sulfotelmatobacter sp.]
MLQTSARLLRLLSLFQAQRYWSGSELSRRLDVTGRTLRRDVDRLRSLGYPVHSTSGTAGGYQLGAGANLPPLLLDDDEAVAVALGLRTSASGSVTGIEEASVRALLKLEQVLPSRLRHRVAALHSFIVPLTRQGPTVDADRLSVIAGACRDHEGIRFDYHNRTGAPSARNVEPHRLVHTGYRWYLVAWDTAREDWRTFRVDRIEGKLKTSVRFKPRKPPEGDFAAFVSKSLSSVPYPYHARVTLHAPVDAIAKRVPSSAGVLEAIDDRSCMLHAGAQSLEGITIHLSMLGVDFQVHEPAELIQYMRGLAERLSRASG